MNRSLPGGSTEARRGGGSHWDLPGLRFGDNRRSLRRTVAEEQGLPVHVHAVTFSPRSPFLLARDHGDRENRLLGSVGPGRNARSLSMPRCRLWGSQARPSSPAQPAPTSPPSRLLLLCGGVTDPCRLACDSHFALTSNHDLGNPSVPGTPRHWSSRLTYQPDDPLGTL